MQVRLQRVNRACSSIVRTDNDCGGVQVTESFGLQSVLLSSCKTPQTIILNIVWSYGVRGREIKSLCPNKGIEGQRREQTPCSYMMSMFPSVLKEQCMDRDLGCGWGGIWRPIEVLHSCCVLGIIIFQTPLWLESFVHRVVVLKDLLGYGSPGRSLGLRGHALGK